LVFFWNTVFHFCRLQPENDEDVEPSTEMEQPADEAENVAAADASGNHTRL